MMKLMTRDDAPSHRRRGLPGRAGSAGFTLVELLVVIAIIALLVSILLPALAAAKELANRSVCLSHLNAAGKGRLVYENEYDGWLAGPNTSGQYLSRNGGSNQIQDDDGRETEPIQNMDWASPTLGLTMGFPKNNLRRLVQILDADLKCPSNDEFYDGVWPDATNDPDALVAGKRVGNIRYSSYAATLAFHVLGADRIEHNADIGNGKNGVVAIDDDYRPRVDLIGDQSRKVYLVEGTRYWNGGDQVTFNDVQRQVQGGNFMLYGPSTPSSGDPLGLNNDLSLREENKKFAWRHDDTMNCLYMDGHADNLGLVESLDIDKYFPSGSQVIGSYGTQDPDAVNGDWVE